MNFDEAFSFNSLLDAHKRCRRSKQHKRQTIMFELNLSQNLTALSKTLIDESYEVGQYISFKIFEPKERNIEALSYKDRVVLMALCSNLIEPKLENRLIYDCVACRKGKGTLFGIKRFEKFLHDYYHKFGKDGYFLKCDIRKYFQSINHDVLFEKIKKVGFEEKTERLIKKIIDSKHSEVGVGLPIGNQTSQWFALFYLDGLDRLIKEKLSIKYYVRYMDDLILIHHDKEYLLYCKGQIERFAQNNLKLQLNSKTQIGKLSIGVDFLGFRHKLTESGKVVRLLRSQAKKRLRRNLKGLNKFKKLNLIDDDYILTRVNAYRAHTLHSDSKHKLYVLLKKYNLVEYLK